LVTFVAVAFASVALFAAVVVYQGAKDVSRLVREEQEAAADAVADAAATAFAESGTWESADLDPAMAVGAEAGAEVTILDGDGNRVAGRSATRPGPVEARAVVVDGSRVGTVQIGFAPGERSTAVRHLGEALTTTVAVASGLAALVAIGAAALVARRVTRPLAAVTAAVDAVEGGDLAARVGDVGAPGELGDLAHAFDRMAVALAREDRARRALVADVAHELRTPLTILRASLEGLADGIVEPTRAELLSLHDDVLRLGRVVDDLEQLAAAESSELALRLAAVDLGALAEAAAEAMATQFEAAGIRLDVRAIPVVVRADGPRLRQVLTNLLTNALKFTPCDGTVTVSVHRDGAAASIVVADTGIGIPPEELDRVFDRFWRGAAATTIAGSGIGLTVVAELVKAHGGNVRVTSESGSGTRVTVTLPTA
jgi:two-component system sensor histidine kinase BaeS